MAVPVMHWIGERIQQVEEIHGYWTARHKGRTGQGWSEAEAMKNLMQALRDNPVRPRPKGDNK